MDVKRAYIALPAGNGEGTVPCVMKDSSECFCFGHTGDVGIKRLRAASTAAHPPRQRAESDPVPQSEFLDIAVFQFQQPPSVSFVVNLQNNNTQAPSFSAGGGCSY